MTASLDLQCSIQTADLDENPAGSAGSADRYVLVELPLPWPSKIEDHPALASVLPGPDAAGTTRILGVSSVGRIETERSNPGAANPATAKSMRVICYARTPKADFVAFDRFDATVSPEGLTSLLTAINNGHLNQLTPVTDNQIDVLICTHGSRDRCCGQHGTSLFLELLERSLDGELDPRVRLWRTSHTGGHRFAPTGMTFPDGVAWARLTADVVEGIVSRQLHPAEATALLRGSGGVDGRAAQIADCRGFARHGWEWLDYERSIHVERDPDGGETGVIVTVDSRFANGRFAMQEREPVPVPVCGEPLESSVKTATQFKITAETWIDN